jgi:hypothetical protein
MGRSKNLLLYQFCDCLQMGMDQQTPHHIWVSDLQWFVKVIWMSGWKPTWVTNNRVLVNGGGLVFLVVIGGATCA